jgi:hypothetical protein
LPPLQSQAILRKESLVDSKKNLEMVITILIANRFSFRLNPHQGLSSITAWASAAVKNFETSPDF